MPSFQIVDDQINKVVYWTAPSKGLDQAIHMTQAGGFAIQIHTVKKLAETVGIELIGLQERKKT